MTAVASSRRLSLKEDTMWGEIDAGTAEAFRLAAEATYLGGDCPGGIGTLGERRLHAALKRFLSPDVTTHEISVGRYRADVLTEGHIYEVQTRRMDRLTAKLRVFLETYDVTVVYPVAREKYLSWVDPVTGSVTPPRKSPIHGKVQDCLYELFYLTEFLNHPHFHVKVLLADLQEYRTLSGYGREKKRRAPRAERLPRGLVAVYDLVAPADYARLIPGTLQEPFTSSAYAEATGIPAAARSRAMRVLTETGAVRRVGKRGNAFLYARGEETT